MEDLFLFQTLDNLRELGFAEDCPPYIEEGLSRRVELREYQTAAFQNTMTYFENERISKNKQTHLLYHMATGSGKTVMMAGLILYLYRKGYRKFLFFVNQTNILEKTKENFLNPTSNKYLFSETIEIDGEQLNIKEVKNFSAVNNDAINICFTTTQKLHMDLFAPKENSLTIEDFEDDKIVLISDESHHVNSWTKKPNKTEKAEINSWEYSVNRIFNANRDNIILEFTATCDLKDPNVNAKYKDKIVFDYPLAKFRESGYTKDFQNKQTDYGVWKRTLIALILSEYRRNLFADIRQNIKPVILLKSQKIAESESYYEEFFHKLNNLTPEELESLDVENDGLLKEAIHYFKGKDETLNSLTQYLKLAFAKDNSIIMNGSTDNTTEKQLAVNSLEDSDNPYRIIFTVDMLNEGWDVLNLFDIVRLYETRQGSGRAGKVGSYTIKEAQLIGRGARYCPFIEKDDQNRDKRKYDYDTTNQKRVLETLLYHSFDDSRYINELRQALKETGLLPESPIEIEYKIKESFKTEKVYKEGVVFSNRKIEKSRHTVSGIEKRIRDSIITKKIASGSGKLYGLFEDIIVEEKKSDKYVTRTHIKEVPLNILHYAISNFESLKFNTLKSHFPNLVSIKEFLCSENYAGGITLQIESAYEKIRPIDYYDAVMKALDFVAKHIMSIKAEYEGTREFYEKRVCDVVKDKVIHIDKPQGDGVGVSQTEVNDNIALDLYNMSWYVFNDNYGTSEEKAFVKYFSTIVPELQKKYEKVYLIRNERFPELAIYDFETGERFEPDFLLLMQKYSNDGYDQQQIFIEPKGEHLLAKDKWKEEFLLRLQSESVPVKKYVDDNQYRIIGVPFFNEKHRMTEFAEAMKKIIE